MGIDILHHPHQERNSEKDTVRRILILQLFTTIFAADGFDALGGLLLKRRNLMASTRTGCDRNRPAAKIRHVAKRRAITGRLDDVVERQGPSKPRQSCRG